MDDKKIQSILQDALEEEIPSSEIRLWPGIRAHLVAGKHTSDQQGETMNGTQLHRLQRVALTVLMMAALATLAFVTPQGRVLAQNVLEFFRRSDSYERPLPTEHIPSTEDAAAPTAMPPAPLVSLAEAEALAGFNAAELAFVPDGFSFLGARVYGNAIHIEYGVQGGGGNLIITQSRESFIQSEWDQAPAEYITPVKVGGLNAEIVQGAYVVYPNGTTAKWNPDAPILRLRWVKDGIWLEMAKFGDVEHIKYLDREGLIALAESMTYNP